MQWSQIIICYFLTYLHNSFCNHISLCLYIYFAQYLIYQIEHGASICFNIETYCHRNSIIDSQALCQKSNNMLSNSALSILQYELSPSILRDIDNYMGVRTTYETRWKIKWYDFNGEKHRESEPASIYYGFYIKEYVLRWYHMNANFTDHPINLPQCVLMIEAELRRKSGKIIMIKFIEKTSQPS